MKQSHYYVTLSPFYVTLNEALPARLPSLGGQAVPTACSPNKFFGRRELWQAGKGL